VTDIVERAESFLSNTPYAPLPRHMSKKLIAELKAARAKYSADYAEFCRIRGELVDEVAAARAENERPQEELGAALYAMGVHDD
jgi:hypothetical protein